MPRLKIFVACVAALSLALQGVPAALAQAPIAASGVQELQSLIPVGAGDVISIGVFPVEEYSREVTVQPDGKVEMALIGAVMVKDLTPREIQSMLEAKYAKFISGPKVTVNIRRFSGRRVAILGQIGSPGYFEYRDGMKLLDLVAQSGGVRDLGKPSKTIIIRQAGDKPQTLHVNLAAVLRGEMGRNLALAPGDIVIVPKAGFTRNAEWLSVNVLPWLTLMTLIMSVVVVAK